MTKKFDISGKYRSCEYAMLDAYRISESWEGYVYIVKENDFFLLQLWYTVDVIENLQAVYQNQSLIYIKPFTS